MQTLPAQRKDYGVRRDYAKRDLYKRNPVTGEVQYLATTSWAQSSFEARIEYCRANPAHTLDDVWSSLNEKR